ncbi:MAG TPA: hypothetical protein VF079_07540 [Sphingomicrobium sp.]
MALFPDLKGLSDGSSSRRSQAVTNFALPVTLAWIIAVAVIVTGAQDEKLLTVENFAVGIGAAAFVTVLLSAFQDLVSVERRQAFLFPVGKSFRGKKYHKPSYWAFDPEMLETADLKSGEVAGIDDLQANAEAQDACWFEGYVANRDLPAVGQFSARHIAWRDLVPVIFLLVMLTIPLAWFWWNGHRLAWLALLTCGVILLILSWVAGRHSNNALVVQVLIEMYKSPKKPQKRPAFDVYVGMIPPESQKQD